VKSFRELLRRYPQGLTGWLIHARDRHTVAKLSNPIYTTPGDPPPPEQLPLHRSTVTPGNHEHPCRPARPPPPMRGPSDQPSKTGEAPTAPTRSKLTARSGTRPRLHPALPRRMPASWPPARYPPARPRAATAHPSAGSARRGPSPRGRRPLGSGGDRAAPQPAVESRLRPLPAIASTWRPRANHPEGS
jgi:hypothetical protein